jgi:uncharacterized protein (TIGR00369 family)
MNNQKIVDRLNSHAPSFIKMLGGEIVAVDPDQKTCLMKFSVGTEFCHSVDIVQGGFITAMLDAVMGHAVIGLEHDVLRVASLEISTKYLDVTRAGRLTAVGKILKLSYKTAFLEAQLHNSDGVLLATACSVAKLSRKT